MGVVYEAEQESLGRRVALKVLSAGSLLDPKQVRRFEREAKAAARLHHTNIVPVFGVGHQEGHHYFVMQFIAGLGLDVVLDDLRRLRQAKSQAGPAAEVARSLMTGRFAADAPPADGSATEPFADAAPVGPTAPANGPPPESSSAVLPGSSELSSASDPDRPYYRSVARVGIQVAEALEFANHQGILHRDVKPSNLLLDNHGNVWVADFGLAKTAEADDLTHTGDILGTIRYMAPERFSGHCDARSDVYSLGLTLYELLALRPAFEASDRHALIERVLHEEPEPLRKRAAGVPRDLETIVAKAMARDPAARYATAGALAEDLRRFVEDRPIRARRISAPERAWRWCRRNRAVAVALGLVALALVAVAVLSLLYAEDQRRHASVEAMYARDSAAQRDMANNLADRLVAERNALKSSLAESNRRLAMLDFERGQAAFKQGQVGPGMLWTVEALRAAAAANDAAWRHAARANLSAWRRQLAELKGVFSHGDTVNAVAFSPDGKTILTGSADKTARLWDAASGRALAQPMLHPNGVASVRFSPDGKTILTGCRDSTARLWDAASGRPLGQPLAHSGAGESVAFSRDGKTILTGSSDKTARLWDAATGQPLGSPMRHSGVVRAVAFSPDGKTVLTVGADRTARLWDVASGRPIGPPLAHPGVSSVAFSPDGKTILTGSNDKTARLWDTATGRSIGPTLAHSDRVSAVAFSPDGWSILTGCWDNTAQLWDAATGQRLGQTLKHQGGVCAVAFSPDGRSILTASTDGRARLWDGAVGQPVGRPLEYGDEAIWAAAFSRDGKTFLAAGPGGRIRLWDVAAGRLLGPPVEHGPEIIAVASSPDGKSILAGSMDGSARLWDVATRRPLGALMMHSGPVSSVAFSRDGKTILTGSADRTARLWDAASGRPIGPPLVHSDFVYSVAFSPDGKTILTGGGDSGAAVGCRHRPAHRPDPGVFGRGALRGVQPRRSHDPHREL